MNINFDKEIEAQRLKLDRQETKICFYCDRCNSEIYEGQDYYMFEKDCLCEDCFDELQKDEKFKNRRIAGDDDE